ncbi:hypothetical protein CTI12_AA349070 [Artemisia annua]|uniref:Uncharacterized protein n=1 Tax=Artemisia annua TaxID=35608 RepID=A0A2U1ML68_ARTAN|nr:hypothetical protein CTI12_AA349070 [Artemisia annua]
METAHGHKNEVNQIHGEELDMCESDEAQRSYSSLGLGRVATIDEDKWYEFDEEINVRIELYMSKFRSQAIGRRGIGGYY